MTGFTILMVSCITMSLYHLLPLYCTKPPVMYPCLGLPSTPQTAYTPAHTRQRPSTRHTA